MFLKVKRDEIIEGLQKSANIIPAKTGAAFLRTIWLKAEEGRLSVMSTDSNLEFCGSYACSVQEDGLAGVQGRAFYDLVRKLPAGSELTLTTDGEKQNLLVEQGARKYKLPVNDPEWFQKFSAFPDNGTIFWSGDMLNEIIDRIAFCISDEDSMEAIACLYMLPAQADGPMDDKRQVDVCGLNGHQFAMFSFMNDDVHGLLPEEGILIQKKYLLELKKWLSGDEIELSISNKRLFFRTGDRRETFSLPLSYYQYPNFRGFLAKLNDPASSRLHAKRAEMIDALERISIFNTETNRCTYLAFRPEETILSSQGQEMGSATETLESGFQGELPHIAFPTKNLIEILNHFGSENVKFVLTGAEAPCGITGENDPEYLVILMPMMIQEETYYSEENA